MPVEFCIKSFSSFEQWTEMYEQELYTVAIHTLWMYEQELYTVAIHTLWMYEQELYTVAIHTFVQLDRRDSKK